MAEIGQEGFASDNGRGRERQSSRLGIRGRRRRSSPTAITSADPRSVQIRTSSRAASRNRDQSPAPRTHLVVCISLAYLC